MTERPRHNALTNLEEHSANLNNAVAVLTIVRRVANNGLIIQSHTNCAGSGVQIFSRYITSPALARARAFLGIRRRLESDVSGIKRLQELRKD